MPVPDSMLDGQEPKISAFEGFPKYGLQSEVKHYHARWTLSDNLPCRYV
jgi:hypothetical protein